MNRGPSSVADLYRPRDREWDDLFRSAGARHNVPPSLLKGIAASESDFNPGSVLWEPSHKSTKQPGDTDASRGLMQTTQEAARRIGWPSMDGFDKLFDPEVSIEYGAREIAYYLANPRRNMGPKSQGKDVPPGDNIRDAVAAYNMGYPRSIRNTTSFIAKIYGYPMTYATTPPPGWLYANQPYIDRVISYAALYDADLKGDKVAVADALALLKAKDRHSLAMRYAPAAAIGAGVVLVGLGLIGWLAYKARSGGNA